MSLEMRIQEDLVHSMKARDELRLGTLRMLKAALQLAHVEKGKENQLAEEEVITVIQRLIKQRREAADQYRAHGAAERAESELDEARILEGYLPEQLDDEALTVLVNEAVSQLGAKGPRDMGKVMGVLMPKVKGRADGNRVRGIVGQVLGQAQP